MPPDKNTNVAKEYEGYEALTPWLDRKIREISGKPEADGPLTFGDLWGAKGFPPRWLEEDFKDVDETRKKSINLQLVTTNLTHGRPYILPFDDQLARIFFRRDELEPFFPEYILNYLLENSKEYKPADGYPQGKKAIRELPAAKDLPVLFGARLSLSFPGLLSAIPLYAIDEEPKKSKRKLERCWFSDGGISSNFPIHFFDGFLPIWPTFGFTLEETLKHSPNRKVGMPSTYEEGREESWTRFHDKKDLDRLTGFFGAIFNAARNWNDNTLTRMPGVRERVVHIYLDSKKEGGLNLNMPKKTIKQLVGRGKRAANEIVRRYVNKSFPGNGVMMDFENHAWVRLNTFVDMFSAHIPELKRALDKKQRRVDYHKLIHTAGARVKGQYPLTDPKDIARLIKFINVLSSLPNKFKDGTIVQDTVRPVPKGALRGRPLL
nr:patatin-like phospholipase family protein [Nitrosospira multiformis]